MTEFSSDSESEYDVKKFFVKARKQIKKIQKSITFCWDNISVYRKKEQENHSFWRGNKYKNVQLLHNVSGFVKQGSVMAIMGPSGSGKTTFLASISFRIKDGIDGNIYINGERINSTRMIALSGFVSQHDLIIESLTVFEHMKLMAILKMDRKISEIQRLKKIILLMDNLGISHCGSIYIRNLSGGERRRLSIAVQLLTDPVLLFCDEPTTGLDSAATQSVIKLLKKFASEGNIVISSIHQPAAAVFELFDDVLLLASGGRVAYFGPVFQTVEYFRRLNLYCPPSYNIAEFLINTISFSDFKAAKRIENLCASYRTSKTFAIVEERIKAVCFENYLSSDRCSFFSEYKSNNELLTDYLCTERATWQTQCICLIWRSLIDAKRNYSNLMAHIVTYLMTAIIISLLFSKVTLCDENNIQNIRGYINYIVLETLYIFAYYSFNTFLEERPLVLREISNGLYSPRAYYLSRLFCCMMSSIFNNFNLLSITATTHEVFAYLLAGITYKISSLPTVFTILKYFSIFYYSIEAVTVLEWIEIDDIQCNETNKYLINEDRLSPLEILTDYGFDVVNFQDDLWILMAFAIAFHFIAYKFIVIKCKNQSAAY
ncbi:hypothetical protein PGB90_006985 [Kerria lacca]